MSSIKVSIFVPMYNVEDFIEKCSISLFMQTYQNIEYIFVNDCTPDNSLDVLEKTLQKFPERKYQVKIINHEVNKGIAATRNTGILNATGEYLLQVDGDDYIDTRTVELMLNKAIAEKADIVLCNYYLEFKKKNIEVKHGFLDKEQYLNDVLSAKIPPSIWNKLIRLEVYKKNNLLFKEGVNYGEDYMLVPQIIYFSNKISSVDMPFYNYIRWNLNSYTAKITSKHIFNIKDVIFQLKKFFNNKDNYWDSVQLGISQKKIDLLRDSSSYKVFLLVNFELSDPLLIYKETFFNSFVVFLISNRFYFLTFLIFSINKKIKFLYGKMKGRC